MIVELWPLDRLIEYARNPRKNDHAVDKIAAAIHEFGFRVPILAKSDGLVVDGHLRLKAARKLGLETVPVILADDMTDVQIKAFRVSVNRMAEIADWDDDLLRLELEELREMDFDLELTGFDAGDLEKIFDNVGQQEAEENFSYVETFSVVVTCRDEAHQREVYDGLIERGYDCRVLVN